VPMQQLPMFGCTLICERLERGPRATVIHMRRASSDDLWDITLMNDNPMAEHLARPGSCFALVELASVGQVASRGRY
jgi:hypothetical protein